MTLLNSIINTLTTEEHIEFIQFLSKKNRRGDTKNEKLFKLITSGKTDNLDVILYNKPSKNALHALNNRLQNSLIDFIATKNFAGESNEELEILKLLLASRIFFEHKQIKTALRTLSKAEKKATELNLYSILTEIFHTKIQYAHLDASTPLEETITASRKNLNLFTQEQQLNMLYATIKGKIKEEPAKDIAEIITSAFHSFDIDFDESLGYKSLFQLMQLSATSASLQSNFYTVMPFLMRLYDIVKLKHDQAEKNLYYHLEILNMLAIATFRNKDFARCYEFILKMESEIEKQQGKFQHRFAEKLAINKSLYYNYTNKPLKAISILENFDKESLDIDLILVMCRFQQQEYKDAYSIIKGFNHSDIWYEKKKGLIWVVKKNILEILLHIELDNFDLVLSRLDSFQNKYSKRLKKADEKRVLNFVNLVSKYYKMPTIVNTETFKTSVENSFEWIGTDKEDVLVMSFYAWLKAKMEQKDLYETTLSLVHKS